MKNKVVLTLLLFAAITAHGVTAARAETKANRLVGTELKTKTDYSELQFTFAKPVKYSLSPDVEHQTLKLTASAAEINPALDFMTFEDERVKGVTFYMEGRKAVAEIAMSDFRTSIYHSLSGDGLRLTVRLKSRKKLMALKSDVKKEKSDAKKAARDREIVEQRRKVFDESGKELYKKALQDLQKKRYRDAANKFAALINKYPNSIYLEQTYFSRAEALYREAKKEKDKVPDAIESYRLAAVKFPSSEYIPRSRLRLGELNFEQNMDIEALASYDSLATDFPDSKYKLSALLGKAGIFLRREQYDKAYNELERILLFYPEAREVREARFKIAEAFYLRKRYDTALQIFEDSDRKWPTYVRSNSEALNAFADSYFQLRKYDRAEELYTELVNLFPEADEGKDAVNILGDIYAIRGQPETALKFYGILARRIPGEKAGLDARLRLAALGHADDKIVKEREAVIWTFPDYFHPMATYDDIIKNSAGTVQARDALYQKAWLFNQRKQYIESVLTLKEMMIKFPQTKVLDPVANLVRNNLYKLVREQHDQGGYYSILRIYYENFEPFFMDIKEPDVIAKIGDAYYEMGLYDRSIEKFDQLRDADKADRFGGLVRYGKGRAYAAEKKYAEAVEMLDPFAGMLDNSEYAPAALHLLGDIYNVQSEKEKAVKSYMRAIAIEPNGGRVSETAYKLGMLFKEEGRYRQAVNFFNKAITKYTPMGDMPDPFHVRESYYQLIEANYRDERFDDAIIFADHAVKRYPDQKQTSWALYVKSDSETELSEDEKAVASLRELAKKEPSTIYGKVASATIQVADWKLKYRELFN
ncbi:MAG: tetratricopeptide repeat protein [Nitrospinota bacterium]